MITKTEMAGSLRNDTVLAILIQLGPTVDGGAKIRTDTYAIGEQPPQGALIALLELAIGQVSGKLGDNNDEQ